MAADQLGDDWERAYAYHEVVLGQLKAGDIDGAQQTASLLRDETDIIGTRIKDKSLREIARALAQAGDFPKAEKAIAQISDQVERCHSLALVAEAEGKKGKQGRAKKRLDQARELVRSDSPVGSVLTLAAIRQALIVLRDFEGARTVAASIKTGIRDEILKEIASAEIRAGDLKAALKTFESIKHREHKQEAARIIAAERMRKGDSRTLSWAEQLATPSERVYALLGMVDALNSKNK